MWKKKLILNSVLKNALKTITIIYLIVKENLIQIYNY